MAGYYDGGTMTLEQYDGQGGVHLFNCPANTGERAAGYAANMLVMREPDRMINGEFMESTTYRAVNLQNPGRLIMIADNSMETRPQRWFDSGTWEDIIGFRHGGHANVLYADLSVGVVTPDEISEKNIDPEWE
jgi:prepilin-type processing-associated H-X9-DG protein